ncbi:cytochrome P450 [Streptomyces sp. NPDC046261]|uniref:cytochrome P450 n=1 Tax=Streptomyces sp. NPDC046261 TaxID=3157200 RepID=UPI0033C31DEC
MSGTVTESVPAVPMPRTCPYRPPGEYARLRARGPASRVTLAGGRWAWLVTGHREVRALLADPRMSADATDPRYPELAYVPEELLPSREVRRRTRTFVQMDLPEQGVHRRMVLGHFGSRRVAALRPFVEESARVLVGRMLAAGPPADLVRDFAAPLPAWVLTEVFGVPAADRPSFRARLARGERGIGELAPYLERVLAEGAADGLLGTMTARVRAGELTSRQALATLMMLLVAGHETTENMLAVGTLVLLTHPARREGPPPGPRDVPGAVEELLRYVSTADLLSRVATADIDLAATGDEGRGGVRIRAGDGVLLSLAAANRDGRVFADPDVFDPTRPGRGHLAFGHGPHQCLGNALARLELTVGLTVLLTRVPTLRPAVPAGRLPVKPALSLQGVTRLPVTWEPGTTA